MHSPELYARTSAPALADKTLTFSRGTCSLGEVLVACTSRGICQVALGDQARLPAEPVAARWRGWAQLPDTPHAQWALAQVVRYIEHPAQAHALALDPHGTPFQQSVWRSILGISAGTTLTYGELAARVGRPTACRAVASACGANPLAVIIPCHRVVASTGKPTGYRWGLARKATLLRREQSLCGG